MLFRSRDRRDHASSGSTGDSRDFGWEEDDEPRYLIARSTQLFSPSAAPFAASPQPHAASRVPSRSGDPVPAALSRATPVRLAANSRELLRSRANWFEVRFRPSLFPLPCLGLRTRSGTLQTSSSAVGMSGEVSRYVPDRFFTLSHLYHMALSERRFSLRRDLAVFALCSLVP